MHLFHVFKRNHINKYNNGVNKDFLSIDDLIENGHASLLHHDYNNISSDTKKYIKEKPLIDELKIAAQHGYLNIIKIVSKLNNNDFNKLLLDYPAQYGRLDIVKFLHKYFNNKRNTFIHKSWKLFGHVDEKYCSDNALIYAIRNNHTDVINYLIENRNSIDELNITDDSIECAISCNNYDLMMHLYDLCKNNNNILCKQLCNKLYNKACIENRLDLIMYLLENTNNICCENTINLAGNHNNIDIVDFLHQKFGYRCNQYILDNAIDNDFNEIVKHIGHYDNINYSEKLLNYSIKRYHNEIVKNLYTKFKYKFPVNIIDIASEYGNFDILKFLFNKGLKPTNIALDMASINGHLYVVQYLIENCNCKYSADTMDFAVRNNHYEIVKYLVSKGVPYSENSLISISQSNNFEMYKILYGF